MASERALHGRKTNWVDFDHIDYGASSWNKTRLARNRRIDDRDLVAAELDVFWVAFHLAAVREDETRARLCGSASLGTLERLP